MFKSFQSNNSIPNNYVYTSNKGTEYMYLEGSWVNCETMNTVQSTHNYKMNQSAIRQIAEHNETNFLQIGKKYVINESEYTYVGRNNFSFGENLLTESMNSKIQRLVEAEQFTNFVHGDKESTDIPNGFSLYRGEYNYNKNKNQWSISGTPIESKQDNADLNKTAIKEIEKYNKQDDYAVGSTIDWKGETMTWTGTRWISPEGKRAGDKFTSQVDDFINENPGVLKSKPKPKQSAQPETSEIPKNQKITMRDGENYYWDGKDSFRNQNGDALDAERNQRSIDSWKRYKSGAAPTHSMGDQGNGNQSIPQEQSKPEKSTSDEITSTEVPNGFVYKSGKGNSYFKKAGQWFSSITKKPINSSSAAPLERAAQAQVNTINSESPIKIGQEWKSKKGINYKYAGGDRWISDEDKLLPISTAKALNQQLSSSASQKEPSEVTQDQEASEPQQNSQSQPTVSNVSDNFGSGDSSLESLANEIKSNPMARKIVVLLSRGDDLSLLAADILLSGQQKEAAQILKSLNNED